LSQCQAAQVVGVHRHTVNVWIKRYGERGEDGVLDGRRVLTRGRKGWIAGGTPGRLQRPFALWTSRAVRELAERRFVGRFGLATVRLYLRRCGTTSRKPLARAKEHRPAVAGWLETAYATLAERAKRTRP
jgi:transposase